MAGFNVSVGADSRKAERELKSFEQKTKKIAGSIAKGFKERIGHRLFDGLSGALRTLPGLLNSSINDAASLNEEIGKSELIFKKSADQVKAWAKTTTESYALTELEALRATGAFGGFFTVLGKSEKDAAEMSMTLSKLAVDMASLNDRSIEEALEAITSGLKGSNEPLQKFNVIISESILKEKAFEKGLSDGKGTLDAKTKALVAYELILDQAANANGNFQNTQDGLANSQKTLAAQFGQMKIEIGKGLLPAMQDLVLLLRETDFKEFGKDVGELAKGLVELGKSARDSYTGMKMLASLVTSDEGSDSKLSKFLPPSLRILSNIKSGSSDFNKIRNDEIKRRTKGGDFLTDAAKMDPDKLVAKIDEDAKKLESAKKKLENVESKEEEKEKIQQGPDYGKRVKALTKDLIKIEFDKDFSDSESQAQSKAEQKEREAEAFQTRLRDELYNLENQLSASAGRSSNVAVSSMQRIGGGGGVYSELGSQKKQAELQSSILEILKEMKANPPGRLSDF